MNKLLVVDSDHGVRLLLQEELGLEGWEPIIVGDLKDSLKTIKDQRPDLMVVDIKLGETKAHELLWKIRNIYNEMPIILFTAYPLSNPYIRSLPSDYYVIKSSDLSVLKLTIEVVLKDRKAFMESDRPVSMDRRAKTISMTNYIHGSQDKSGSYTSERRI